jgi:hypothetical protein
MAAIVELGSLDQLRSDMIYLRKANNDLISHCKCADAYISAPGQMDCPWCGCGWLFTCSHCRKAFTFAEAVEVDFSLEQMARRDFQHLERPHWQPSEEDLKSWIDFMGIFLRRAQVGQRYVYFDGYIIPVDADGLKIEGICSSHDLAVVPQVQALRDPSIIRDLLSSPRYWRETARQTRES